MFTMIKVYMVNNFAVNEHLFTQAQVDIPGYRRISFSKKQQSGK